MSNIVYRSARVPGFGQHRGDPKPDTRPTIASPRHLRVDLSTAGLVGRRVYALGDDSPCPLPGVILWVEDRDAVAVAWGLVMHTDEARERASLHYMDELMPA